MAQSENKTNLLHLPVSAITRLFQDKKLSPVEYTQSCLKQALKYNPLMNGLCYLDEQAALHQARSAEKRWIKGEAKSPIDGIPVTIKDWFDVKGWPTRMGSKTSSALAQTNDSPVVQQLKDAGAVFMAKTTLPEFGHKGVTDSPLTGISRNPWDSAKTCGGSSGGAAIAAATRIAPLNLGSDAGGSIRIPASFCGIVGFKPSPGVIPAYPPSLFSSLSSSGPMTTCVDDAAVMMDILAFNLPQDFHTAPLPPQHFAKNIDAKLPKLKIAVAHTINGIAPTAEVAATFDNAIKTISSLGNIETIALDAPELVDTFNKHWMAVASLMASRISSKDKKLMDARFLHWAARGDTLHLHEYLRAEHQRMMIGSYFKDLLTNYDLIITPTTAMTAFDVGSNMPIGADGELWDDWTPFTYPANLARLPAISIPCGMTKAGLPVGMQIMSGNLRDLLVLQTAKRIETQLAFKQWGID